MKWHKNWKQLLKTYSFLSLVGNALISISISGLAVLGLLSSSIAFPVLATVGVVLGVMGAIGRLIDEEIEDANKDS
jgi:hypothetical protein